MKKTLPFLLLCVCIISCKKRIDSSSKESIKKSITQISQSLSDEEKEEFQESLRLIMFNDLDLSKLMIDDSAEKTSQDFKSKIDGMSAEEIIKAGNLIKEKNEQKKKEQARLEILELYDLRENAQRDQQMLAKFEVLRSRFYKRKTGTYYITKEPIIELTVKNGTDVAVSRAYFTGTLASPERSVPWIKDNFNYEISGGLEPGEKVTWSLAPNTYGDWGNVDAPKGAILTVEVTQIDNPEGKAVYSLNNYGTLEEERLQELLTSYPEFAK